MRNEFAVVFPDEHRGARRAPADVAEPAEGVSRAETEPAGPSAESHQPHGCHTELHHGSH